MITPKIKYLGLLCVIALLGSCDKFLPEDRDTLEKDALFSKTLYEPVLGRHEMIDDNFNHAASSLPIEFKLLNIRTYEGELANELMDIHPVKVWKKPYLGTEKSIEEIEAKRNIEYRPLFEIGKYNGRIEIWPNASSNFVRTQPDSCYLFDVEISSTGGRKYFRGLQLRPKKERPYEPSNQNQITGQINTPYVRGVLSNVKGNTTGRFLTTSDMTVYFHKLEGNPYGGKTLTFKFADSLMRPINPNEFDMSEEEWKNVIHGFNMQKTDEYVRYDVAYPIPLINYVTPYTNESGQRARARFIYKRLGFGQILETAYVGIDFGIYEEGDWEIYFVFPDESPRFNNE